MRLFLAPILVVACGTPRAHDSGPSDGVDTDAASTDDGTHDDGATDTDAANDTDASEGVCTTCLFDGRWAVDNLSPCFYSEPASTQGDPDAVTAALSTILDPFPSCPDDPTMKPATPWSTDSLTADCAGHYRLCVTLKAGDGAHPGSTDCTMAQSCAEGDFTTPNVTQAWTDLESWISTPDQLPCAQQFRDAGGYGEMTVTGHATGCGTVTKTLAHVTYCPLACNLDPEGDACGGCQEGGGGGF